MTTACNSCKDSWSILIKPTHMCNFNCKYCYDEPYRRKFKNTVMSMETLNEILKRVAKHTKKLTLIWHGGEPLIVGKQWYIDAQRVIGLYPELQVSQHLQTNGSLLDAEWASLAGTYGIEIGVSFDGPFQSVRDSRYEEVEGAIKEFKEAGGNLGFICVVNQENYGNLIDIYEYFKNELQSGFSFNRIFGSLEADKNGLMVTVDDYQREFIKLYDHWLHDNYAIEERTSLESTRKLFGLGGTMCTDGYCLYSWIGVNPIGELYPCDRYVPEKYNMGMISDYETIGEAYSGEAYSLYAEENVTRMIECNDCDYGPYCGGGCVANHVGYAGDATKNDPDQCLTFKRTYRDIYEYWREVDVENEIINTKIIEMFIEGPMFTVSEIRETLSKLDPNIELKYDRDIDRLIKCSEFEVFRIVNTLKKSSLNSHVDYMVNELEISVYTDAPEVMREISGERRKLLTSILLENMDEIVKIVSKGV